MEATKKKQLLSMLNSVKIETIQHYLSTGDITWGEISNLLHPERRSYLDNWRAHMPNAEEQRQWAEITTSLSTPTQETVQKIEQYLSLWQHSQPSGNHVQEAIEMLAKVRNQIEATQRAAEFSEWNAVNKSDLNSLMGYYGKYPQTCFRKDIDDALWALMDQSESGDLDYYLAWFPTGAHATEANTLKSHVAVWNTVRNKGDILQLKQYIDQNPGSPFITEATFLFDTMREQEYQKMLSNPASYSGSQVKNLLNSGIVTPAELVNRGILTENVLEQLMSTDLTRDLPDIRAAINNSIPECKSGNTDVYFFGVPSTGKTCVLMGLSRAPRLNMNLASGGGDYAGALQQYTDVGITVDRTPGDFVATLQASIRDIDGSGDRHNINLVEMSGEEFVFSITKNDDKVFDFEKMGSGTTALLSNNNKKVFFIIIDPTVSTLHFNREVTRIDPITGMANTSIESVVVNQRIILSTLIDIFEREENESIMRNVDSINFIMTKADMLGEPEERERKALDIFTTRYRTDVLEPLLDICRKYNINAVWKGEEKYYPKLYTFSLGKFYVGGLYEYDPTDSNKLISAIWNSTRGKKKRTMWDDFKSKF